MIQLFFIAIFHVCLATDYPSLKWVVPIEGKVYPMMPTNVNFDSQKKAIFASGYHPGPLFGVECPAKPQLCCYLIKFNAKDGTMMWINFWGNGKDGEWNGGLGVFPSTNAPIVSGYTNDFLDGIEPFDKEEWTNDIYVLTFDAVTGTRKSKFFGTKKDDVANDLRVDLKENVYITGWTKGDFGNPNLGGFDAFLMKLDNKIETIFVRQWGTPSDDFGVLVELDPVQNQVWVAGAWNSGYQKTTYDFWHNYLEGGKTCAQTLTKFDKSGKVLYSEIFKPYNGSLMLSWMQYEPVNQDMYFMITTDSSPIPEKAVKGFDDIYVYKYHSKPNCIDECMRQYNKPFYTFGTLSEDYSQQMAIDGLDNYMYVLGHTYKYGQHYFFDHRQHIFRKVNSKTGEDIPLNQDLFTIDDARPTAFGYPLIHQEDMTMYCVAYLEKEGSFLAAFVIGDSVEIRKTITTEVIKETGPMPSKTQVEDPPTVAIHSAAITLLVFIIIISVMSVIIYRQRQYIRVQTNPETGIQMKSKSHHTNALRSMEYRELEEQ